jgi:hypothetical protein
MHSFIPLRVVIDSMKDQSLAKSLRHWTGRFLQFLSLSCTLAHGTLS